LFTKEVSTESSLFKPEVFQNESIQVINEVKNTISSVIKDVLSKEKLNSTKTDIDNLVQKIRDNVPDDVKIKTSIVDDEELQSRIKETVGKILTDEEISSIVQLRNISNVNGKSISPKIDKTELIATQETPSRIFSTSPATNELPVSTKEELLTPKEEQVTASTFPEIKVSSEKTTTRYIASQSSTSFDLNVLSSTPTFLQEEINEEVVLNSIGKILF